MQNLKSHFIFTLVLGLSTLFSSHKLLAEELLLECQTQHVNMRANLQVTTSKASLKIQTLEGRSFVCEGEMELHDRTKNIKPYYLISVDIMRGCNPVLPVSIGRQISGTIDYRYNLFSKKGELDWINFERSTPCEDKVNQLSEYFKK